ncbi:MAG: helix-turn-helix transcriptional regulator [Cyclobacteriaceae bacterium]|nr:helix-turn-helix transcriptional regulator [Cyclobacteriaceae bacterium]
MEISMNMLMFISALGILQAAVLSGVVYFHPRSDHSVSRFLALHIFFFCIPMCTPLVQQFVSWQAMFFMDPFPMLNGPMLYLYVRSFKEDITWRKAWPHLILFFIYGVIDTQLFFHFTEVYPPGHAVPEEVVHNPMSILRVCIRLVQLVVYYFLALNALNTYQRSIQQLFSETSKISLAWVRWHIKGYLILVFAMVGLYFIILQMPEYFAMILLINTSLVTPYIYIITFRGVTQSTLWQFQGLKKEEVEEKLHQAEELERLVHEPKSQKIPSLGTERTNDIVARTTALMEEGRIYLRTDLTLQNLADQLHTPAYQVSQAINEGMGKTFYDLVNGYRIEEAKRLLLDPKTKNTKIIAVGLDSGFNSKTTFNTVFKKFTGYTPTDFRELHDKELVHVQ